MRRLYTVDEFARLAPDDAAQLGIATTSSGAPEFGETGRVVRYLFSTPAVGRDMHTVAAGAWKLANFAKNPVFLWAHDDQQLPIGRVFDISEANGVLRGSVEYAEPDLNPFADMVYRLVRAKYLNAVSTSWQPLEWDFSRDPARAGGIDFTEVDLLEISQVPIPALPSALARARSQGIDTQPMFEWAERLLDKGGMVLMPRTELETLRRAAKMPAARKPQQQGAEGAQSTTAGTETLSPLKAKHTRALSRAPKVPTFKRGLYELAGLACLLSEAGYCHAAAEYEADIEGDGSPVPGMIGEGLKCLGEALIAMGEEEVAEFLSAHGQGDEDDDDDGASAIMRDLSPQERAYIAAAKTPRARAWRTGVTLARAGRSISASNEKQLNDADGHCDRAMKHHRAMQDHQEAIGKNCDDAQEAHSRAAEAHAQVGEHLQAAQDDPEKAAEHVGAAAKAHRAAGKHLDSVAEAHRALDESNEDMGDSHQACGRSIKRCQRCVRSVTQQGTESSEPDNGDADDLENGEAAKQARAAAAAAAADKAAKDAARGARERRLRLLKLQAN